MFHKFEYRAGKKKSAQLENKKQLDVSKMAKFENCGFYRLLHGDRQFLPAAIQTFVKFPEFLNYVFSFKRHDCQTWPFY